jgi:hypothetical protein
MMRIIADKVLKVTPTMCRLNRTWRKENEGRSYNVIPMYTNRSTPMGVPVTGVLKTRKGELD